MATATTPDAKHLELSVSNFGPIAEGRVELRPFTVFVGPSNTGKSYLAILLYALHQFFYSYPGNPVHVGTPNGRSRSATLDGSTLSEYDIAGIFDWLDETLADFGQFQNPGRRFPRDLVEPVELRDPVAALTRATINNASHLAAPLSTEIGRCFGVDHIESLSTYLGSGGTGFSLLGDAPEIANDGVSWEYRFSVSSRQHELAVSVPNSMPLRISQLPIPRQLFSYMSGARPERRGRDAIALLRSLASTVVSDMVGPLSQHAYYLPADRAGVMHAHRVVVRALIANASRASLRRDSPLPVLSGVLGDFLEQLLDLVDSPYPIYGDNDGLATSLETKLMKGTVNVEQEQIDYPSFVYRPEEWQRDLPLMNASSMVSELAPVVFYLRDVVDPGDTLIIEEPESHLHPAMQVEFTRLLARAVQNGIRIIITTHSEWVLEELANLVRLSDLPPERRNGIEDADIALGHDEVGAWFFEPNSEAGGSVVREIPLDTESGTFPAGYGLVTEALYKRWSMINRRVRKAR